MKERQMIINHCESCYWFDNFGICNFNPPVVLIYDGELKSALPSPTKTGYCSKWRKASYKLEDVRGGC